MKIRVRILWIILIINGLVSFIYGQTKQDSVLVEATISNCVQYALLHQPIIQQSFLDEQIAEKQIELKLADWYPQLNMNYNLQHAFDLPAAYFSGNYVRTGTFNASNFGLGLTQNIFNKDLILAGKTAKDIRLQSKQNTSFNKIDIAVGVSKAFYDVLLTKQQAAVLTEAINRLGKSLQDAKIQYSSGIADKTDYKRATIALNNAKAQYAQTIELIKGKVAYLKQLMGYPESAALSIKYDTLSLEKQALVDTAEGIKIENRIEFKILQTQKHLQEATQHYYKLGYLPSLGFFGNYNLGYLNNEFTKIYNQSFTNSNIGIQLAMPIFQGNKRIIQLRQADLQLKRIDWDIISLNNKINTQYSLALSAYKGNLVNYLTSKENIALAEDVYKTLDIQYKSGIKTYLEVIIAEADLRTTQINYYNTLFQLLQSKLDVQKSLGSIVY